MLLLGPYENTYYGIVQQWISDGSKKYKSVAFDKILKNKDIRILQSMPHTPQQNRYVEQFMQILSDKAKSIYFDAYLSESQWNLAFHYRCYCPQPNLTNQAKLAYSLQAT